MQENKQIIIDGKDALIGCGKGVLDVDGGTYVLTKFPDHIHAWYISEIVIRPRKKYIGIVWGQLKIAATELKPMPEYYDAETGKCLFIEERGQDGKESISDRNSYQEVTVPGVGTFNIRSYDAFFEMKGSDKAGVVLCGIALDRFCEKELKVGHVLKMLATEYQLIQPVKVVIDFLARETENDPYRLTVNPIHGVAPYEYSTGAEPLEDPESWQAEPELVYLNPENKSVYVRDSAGTINKTGISSENWQPVTMQAPV